MRARTKYILTAIFAALLLVIGALAFLLPASAKEEQRVTASAASTQSSWYKEGEDEYWGYINFQPSSEQPIGASGTCTVNLVHGREWSYSSGGVSGSTQGQTTITFRYAATGDNHCLFMWVKAYQGMTTDSGYVTIHTTKTSIAAKSATCTSAGNTAGQRCATCSKDDPLNTSRTIPALGHAWRQYEAQAPTCTEIGWNAYLTCSRCNYTTYTEIEALGHNWESESVSSTGVYCSDTRNTCTRCSEVVYESTGTSSRDQHTTTSRVTSQATCTSTGRRQYTCTKCSYSYSSTISALGHDYGSYVTTTEPTCTEAGVETATCSRCTSTTSRAVSALGHYWESESVSSTSLYCSDTRSTCTRCSEVIYESTGTSSRDRHTYTSHVTSQATCTSTGRRQYTCTKCSYSYSSTISALGHDLEEHNAKAPTCTEIGWNAYETCSRCDYTTYEEIEATGHTPGAAATCTTAQTCTVCGTVLAEALGHDIEDHKAKAPTCTEIGWNAYETCSRCDYTTYEEIEATGHTPGAAATCTTAQTCTVCGTVLAEALGHDIEEHEAKAPTCTEIGWNAYETCSRCNYTTYEEIEATGHTPGAAATCTTAQTCSVCSTVLAEALGHDIEDHKAKAPTCTEIGWNAYETCSRCDYTTYSEIEATGHTPGAAATCTTAQTCTVCGTVLAEALSHDIEEHEAKAPTCTEIGWNAYETCSRCDYTTYSEIEATGHTPGAAATCTTAQTCDVCGTVLAEALGHDYQNGYCDICGAIDEAALEEDKGNAKNELDDLAQSVKDEINASDLPDDVKQDLIGSVDQAIEDAKGEVDTAGDFTDIDSILQEVETEISNSILNAEKENAKSELNGVAAEIRDEINATDLPDDVKQDLIGQLNQAIEETSSEIEAATSADGFSESIDAVRSEMATAILNAEKQQGVDSLSDFAENVRSEIEASDLSEGEKADRYEQISAVVESANADIRGAATAADVDRIVEAAKDEIEGIQAIGHIAGPAATCTTAQTCIVCGKELVPALGHTPGAAAMCTTAQTCTVCGDMLAPATGHTAADAVRENEVAPTCTANGSYEEVVYCDVCSVELSRRTVTVNATGHTFGPDATCTEDQTCLVCGEVISAATGHIPGPAATCTAAQTCSVCGTVLTEALGHDLEEHDAQAPTCTEIGWNAYETCSRCDYTTYSEIEATGHTAAEPVRENEVSATCTESGSYDSVVYCDVCNAELSRRIETIAALWHDEIRHEAQAPTCTEIGWSAYVTCSRCDYTTFHAIAATGHTAAEAVRENEVAPTCTANGSYDSVVYCDVCDTELSRNTVTVNATGHVFENGYCSVCGAEENPALENDKDATNEELDDIAQNVKDEINASDLPDDVKEDLIDRVDQAIEDAKGEVSGAQSSDELDEIVGSVNDTIEDAILEAEKENAKSELDDLAQSVKDEINASDLPDDVKEDLIGRVDQVIEDAKAEIDAAQSADGFDQIIENVTGELDELVNGTDTPDTSLEAEKESAKNELDDLAQSVKDEINASDLPDDVKEDLIGSVDQVIEDAKAEIDAAQSADGFDQLIEDVTGELDELVSGTSGTEETKGELWPWLVGAVVLALILSALYAILRIRKARKYGQTVGAKIIITIAVISILIFVVIIGIAVLLFSLI